MVDELERDIVDALVSSDQCCQFRSVYIVFKEAKIGVADDEIILISVKLESQWSSTFIFDCYITCE